MLDKVNSGSRKVAFAKKIALDQLIFAPIALGCITAVVTLADGKTQEEVEDKLKTEYFQILGTNYKVYVLDSVHYCDVKNTNNCSYSIFRFGRSFSVSIFPSFLSTTEF